MRQLSENLAQFTHHFGVSLAARSSTLKSGLKKTTTKTV